MRPLRPDDPREIAGYRVLRLLGAGGMGRVYLGRSRGGRTVAIKVIRPELADDPTFRARFRREVEAARRMTGPWTAPLLDADTEAVQPWLVTGYVPGPALDVAVDTYGPLPAATVRALGAGLAEALAAMHAAGLVHRDLKPSNVLLGTDGPRIIDFGIARALDATSLTRTGAAIGSPAFMSPEQAGGGTVGPPTDVFSLGSVLYFAATGTRPFTAQGLPAVMFEIMTQDPDLAAVPDELRDIIRHCLRKDPRERPSPQAVAGALAPDGAAALMTAGWLPTELVTDLSRRAVELLDLEDETATFAAGPDGGSGPAAGTGAGTGSGPALGPGSGAGPGGAVHGNTGSRPVGFSGPGGAGFGGTGPYPSGPHPAGPHAAAGPHPAGLYGTGPGAAGQPAGTGPGGAAPPFEDPTRLTPPSGPAQPSQLSGMPQGGPGQRKEGRRSSDRLAPALLGGAAAMLLTALIVLFVVLNSSGSDGDNGDTPQDVARTSLPVTAAPDTPGAPGTPGSGAVPTASPAAEPEPAADQQTAAPPASQPAPGGSLTLPAEYAGTWRGRVVSQAGIQQDVTITIRQAPPGQPVARSVHTLAGMTDLDGEPITCTGDMRLVDTSDGIVLEDIPGSAENPTLLGMPVCTSGGQLQLRLQADGTIQYISKEADAGYPTGTLRRAS